MKFLTACVISFALIAPAEAASTVNFTNTDLSPTGTTPQKIARNLGSPRRVAPTAPTLVDTGARIAADSDTRANGSHGIPYTSTRVQTSATRYASTVGENFLSTTYPYRAVGRIVFTTPEGDSICTGTMIRRGIVLTAAHCIMQFGGARYTNWQFTPGNWSDASATAQQAAPYGEWAWQAVEVPATYANGTDIGDGTAVNNDLALIALRRNTAGQHLGQIVGTINYATGNYGFVRSAFTGNVPVAQVSTIGYPGMLDGGDRMQRSDSPTYLTTVAGALQMTQGSDFTGGASGGPWIVNLFSALPVRSGGAVIGANSGMRVIGVTSWGAAGANAPKDNYASRLGQNPAFPNATYGIYGAGNIGALMQRLCGRVVPGSTQTYAQLGYCT